MSPLDERNVPPWGDLSRAPAMRSLDLFATEVMPRYVALNGLKRAIQLGVCCSAKARGRLNQSIGTSIIGRLMLAARERPLAERLDVTHHLPIVQAVARSYRTVLERSRAGSAWCCCTRQPPRLHNLGLE